MTFPINSGKRVLCVIGAFEGSTGLGGHYFSCITTVRELQKKHSIELINLGDFFADSIKNSSVRASFISTPIRSIDSGRCLLYEKMLDFKPDVVIAFDVLAGLFIRPLCSRIACGFVQVKAGGDIPITFFPRNLFQVHFIRKDVDWANSRVSNKKKLIVWIPNRVETPERDCQALDAFRTELNVSDSDIIIIRIGRISESYRPAFLSAFALKEFLGEHGYPVRLFIIGAIESPHLYDELSARCKGGDAILTERKYTYRASRLLNIAAINVGVGRGFMEGCAEGQHMFAVARNSILPARVSDGNFSHFFDSNFSMRAELPEVGLERDSIIEVANLVLQGKKSITSRNWYERHFSSERVCALYEPVIYAASKNREVFTSNVLLGEIYLRTLAVQKRLKNILSPGARNALKNFLRARLG